MASVVSVRHLCDDVAMRVLRRTSIVTALAVAAGGVFLAQDTAPVANQLKEDIVYVCPMDKDVRSNNPGACPRCGMKLQSDIPEPKEYHMELKLGGKLQVGVPTDLAFGIHDPWKGNPVKNFQVIHEKLFHMFVVSEDLEYFVHDHPTLGEDGEFHYKLAFPKAGMFRILGDFFPDGATPQLIPKTVMVPGKPPSPVRIGRDYSAKTTENLEVALRTEPEQPLAGIKTQMHFALKPGGGIEKLLGAWGHMLVASDDLIDMVHEHPFIADGGPQVQFNATFPRPIPYRVWVQFQRNGVVNTAHFDIKVEELR
jgi:hypothetical protein